MKRLILATLASGLAIAAATPANAALILAYSLDGTTINTLTNLSANPGSAIGSSTAGGFNFDLSATGAPTLASPALTTNTINAKAIDSKTDTLFLYVTQTNNTAYTGNLMSSFTSQLLTGGAKSVTITSYVDETNSAALFGGTQLGQATFTTLGTSTSSSAISLAAPFATTIRYALTFDGAGTFNDSAQLVAVPEPATWGMMIVGFGLMGGVMRRRKTTVAFA